MVILKYNSDNGDAGREEDDSGGDHKEPTCNLVVVTAYGTHYYFRFPFTESIEVYSIEST